MKITGIKKILAYVAEDDNRLLKEATKLAINLRARLTLIDVVEELPGYIKFARPKIVELATMASQLRRQQLEALANRIRTRNINVETSIVEGQSATEIVREVLRNRHDLLVTGLDGPDGCRVGTNGMRILRKCPCPVWIVRPPHSRRRFRVLAAVDTVPGDTARADLNAKILTLADSVARLHNGELHVIHVWRAYGEESLLQSPRYHRDEVEKYIRETGVHHEQELRALLKRVKCNVPAKRVHLNKGDAGKVIPSFCKTNKVDLLVMGTVARAGLSAALIGNTAETVANQVECSILAVKPEGFISPVRLKPPVPAAPAS